jgi:hypothetical protein
MTEPAVEELKNIMSVKGTAVGSELILPGMSYSKIIKGPRKLKLTLASMLAKTNDAFIAKKNISLNLEKGRKKTVLLYTYDAGAEINNESKDFIPAFGAVQMGTEKSEGFVHFHPGISGDADLESVTDSFAPIAAKVVIKRIK